MTPLISVSPLQLSHKCRPIPSKATAINTDECSKGIFQTLKFGKAAEPFFFAINCQKNKISIFDLLLPKNREGYSFPCLNKAILNEKFISNLSQQLTS